jgi:hypothetical protein
MQSEPQQLVEPHQVDLLVGAVEVPVEEALPANQDIGDVNLENY